MDDINELATLRRWLDSSLNKSEPADGLIVMNEAKRILKRREPLCLLGLKAYKYLAENIGSEEKLATRFLPAIIGGMSAEQLQHELETKKLRGSSIEISAASEMLGKMYQSEEFLAHQASVEMIRTIRLNSKELGFPNGATTKEILRRIASLGLEICPAEVGPRLRLEYDDAVGSHLSIAMKPILDDYDRENWFTLHSWPYDKYEISNHLALSDSTIWHDYSDILFRIPDKRKVKK
jgi:hypothetical protein